MSDRDNVEAERLASQWYELRRVTDGWLADQARELVAPGAIVIEAGIGPDASPFWEAVDDEDTLECCYLATDRPEACRPGGGALPWNLEAGPYEEHLGRADIVVLSHVLEHVLDPDLALRHVFATLRPGGTCVGTVPFLFAIHDPVDYWRFTHFGLGELARRAGFREAEQVAFLGLAHPDAALGREPLGFGFLWVRP